MLMPLMIVASMEYLGSIINFGLCTRGKKPLFVAHL